MVLSGTAHCADMYPARDSDLKGLTEARKDIELHLSQWLQLPWLAHNQFDMYISLRASQIFALYFLPHSLILLIFTLSDIINTRFRRR